MAGEWIKVEAETADKPELMRLARLLNLDRDTVLGKLVRLWSWFDRNSVDGHVDGVVDADVDALVRVDGFASALSSVGWLDFDNEQEWVSLPNFERHNGETAKKRVLKSKRQARWRQNNDAEVDDNVDDNVDGPASTSATTREEKSRYTPHNPPQGGKRKNSKPAIGIQRFLDNCREADETPIPVDSAVFAYAEDAGIPHEFLRLCFLEFVERNKTSGKRYKDWRKAFLNCVRGRWYRLWFFDADGNCRLTTDGVQAMNKHQEAMRRAG